MAARKKKDTSKDLVEISAKLLAESKQVEYKKLPSKIKDIIDDYLDDTEKEEFTIARATLDRLMKQKLTRKGLFHNALPMVCDPENCPIRQNACWIYESRPDMIKKFVGKPCPIEQNDIDEWTNDYLSRVCDRLGLEPDEMDIVLRNEVLDLVSCDVLIRRSYGELSKRGMMMDRVVGVDRYGQGVMDKDANPIANVLRNLQKRKDELLKHLLQTPEMVAKYKKKFADDFINEGSTLVHESIETLRDKVHKLESDIKNKKK